MQRSILSIFIGSSVVLMSFSSPAIINKAEKPTKNIASKKITVYQVDNKESKLSWIGKKITGQHEGTIDITEGKLDVEHNTLKSGSFSLNTRSIVVTDIKDAGSNAKLLGHLKSDDFFSVEKFPAATFTITSAPPKGNGQYEITGNLTIKGITHPVTFPATITISNNKLTAKAAIKVDRTKYNIKYGSKSFFEGIGDKAIYDDFDLNVILVATAK